METRCGSAGTQLLDGTWKRLEDHIPDNFTCPRTAEGIARWTEYIRFAQWMQMVGSSDRWTAFCKAAQQYDEKTREEKLAILSRPVKQARVEAAAQVGLSVADRGCAGSAGVGEIVSDFQGGVGGMDQSAGVKHEEDDAEDKAEGIEAGVNDEEDGVQDIVLGGEDEAVDREAEALLEELLAAGERAGDDTSFAAVAVHAFPGSEFLNPPSVDYGALLGYSIAQDVSERMLVVGRGCQNLESKHCYAIALLRALSTLSSVQRWVQQHAQCHNQASASAGCVLCMLNTDLEELAKPGPPFVPSLTLHRVAWSAKWTSARQECAFEAFALLRQHCQDIDEATVAALGLDGNKAALFTYPSVAAFGGLLENTVQCNFSRCGHVSRKIDVFVGLSLNIPTGSQMTLGKALEQAQEVEDLSDSPCPQCGKDVRSKQLRVVRWPQALVLHIKRWRLGACGRRWVKDQRGIFFESTLDCQGAQYKLTAVVCHIGNATGGHYVAYVRLLDNEWYKCNDEELDACAWENVVKDQGYVFFFERCA
jgi:hypothetical protein